jgi:hypothetical protein
MLGLYKGQEVVKTTFEAFRRQSLKKKDSEPECSEDSASLSKL